MIIELEIQAFIKSIESKLDKLNDSQRKEAESKVYVLNKTLEYIKELHQDNRELNKVVDNIHLRELKELRENLELKEEIVVLKNILENN